MGCHCSSRNNIAKEQETYMVGTPDRTSISDRVMRPALSEQCLVRGAENLVPLAAAPERKRVTLDSCPVARPSQSSVNHTFGANMFHLSQ